MKLFISHATEDKAAVARPLASALIKQGHSVWYDEFSLTIGDSLRQSIDHGLATCDYGIVILSKAFFSKAWPRKELDGLFSREIEGKKIILPVWHQISAAEIKRHSPMLADKLAATTQDGLEKVVEEIQKAIANSSPSAVDTKVVDSFVRDLQTVKSGDSFNTDKMVVDSKTAINQAITGIEKEFEKAGHPALKESQGLETSLIDFDAFTGGLTKGKAYVFTGARGVGKTSLAITIARNLLLKDKAVLIVNSEMSPGEITSKIFLGAARVSFDAIKSGYLTEAMFPRMTRAAGKIANSKLTISARNNLFLSDLYRICGKLKSESALDCVIIDDETALMIDTIEANSALLAGSETAWCCRQLKKLSQELDLVGVLTLCPSSRQSQERSKKQNAENQLWFPARKECDFFAVIEEADEPEADDSVEGRISSLVIKILVNTMGDQGEIPVILLKDLARVESIAPDPN